tara:strand:- start:179 stop:967 length:789 start_codon:yes stop_codon:yes gene_type:complete
MNESNNRDMESANFYLDLLKNIQSAWKSHYWIYIEIIKKMRPDTIVELGTDRGFSLLAAMFALSRNKIDGKVYAIDAWGKNDNDKSVMITGESRYEKLKNEIIPQFTKKYKLSENKHELVREYFSDAQSRFDSIDLLHIDGNHTYEDCKRDYEEFKDKVDLKKGCIIFHDIARGKTGTRKEHFGVYRLFNEIDHKKLYFLQHSGLGIVSDNENLLNYIEDICTKMITPVIKKNPERLLLEITDQWKIQHITNRDNIDESELY